MVIYNLDETPNIFISVKTYGQKFMYRMSQVVGDNRHLLRWIDLRNDKLRIYGNEINESMFQRLYDSLTFRNREGCMWVNCDGACYFIGEGKYFRLIHDVIFDWSPFGVRVPNSVNDLLRKELEQINLQKVNAELSCVNSELCSTKDQLESSNNSNNELNERILACERIKLDMEVKLQKACEKITSSDFEIRHYEVELKSCKDKLSTVNSSLKTKNRELEMKLKSLEDEHCLVQSELHSTKDQREVLSKNVKELEERLLSSESRSREMEEELEKVQDQLRKAIEEAQCNVTLLEILRKEVEELNDQIKLHEKEKCFMHKMWSNCFSSIIRIWHPV
ncbi:hypothetical protein RND81_09G098200 [Saponaria officinalis]|uniref:Uncharacterized protein n=1 Tax=Saponaria officinalis TaxID=3572 RepID=A0AAW1IKV4_SAPOF